MRRLLKYRVACLYAIVIFLKTRKGYGKTQKKKRGESGRSDDDQHGSYEYLLTSPPAFVFFVWGAVWLRCWTRLFFLFVGELVERRSQQEGTQNARLPLYANT